MNERIKELAEQCGFRPQPSIYDRNQSFDIEKFAELIVRECAQVADQWVDDEDNGHNLVSDRLRHHFGVEQ